MKCSHIQMRMMDYEDTSLPPDIAQHLATCSACKIHFERARSVRLLMSLKRHERPDAGFETRCLGAVRQRIAELNVQNDTKPASIWERLIGAPVSSVRYALATVLVLLIGLQVVSISEFPVVQPSVSAESAQPQPAAADRFAAATNLPVTPGLHMMPMLVSAPSNLDSGGISYGPGPSTLVNYEY
ncbi:MAG TPA: hypothetical protein PLE77_03615 [Kiritimatiellia bacterium]|nr:hypothetical protein [Kiritimatiellia bacterium]